MARTILLYGANGFSGELIAREIAGRAEYGDVDLILAGRDAERLRELADELGFDYRVFALRRRDEVRQGLRDVNVVLNAAGPFVYTADRLAKVALEVGTDYVDINGEPDVYRRLDDLLRQARLRDRILVSGAGFWAAASNVLLDKELISLGAGKGLQEVGAVRIAMSRIDAFSRGSVATVWRSLREQVLVVRRFGPEPGGENRDHMGLWHEPVGKLERRFDFREPGKPTADIRVGSAVSLVDTLAAMHTLRSHRVLADRIESYVEMDAARRFFYQASAWFTPIAAMPIVGKLVQAPLDMLSLGPDAPERQRFPHEIVLEIEDRTAEPLRTARWRTTNVYQFTAQLAAAVAGAVASRTVQAGWRTPAEVLRGVVAIPAQRLQDMPDGVLRDSKLEVA